MSFYPEHNPYGPSAGDIEKYLQKSLTGNGLSSRYEERDLDAARIIFGVLLNPNRNIDKIRFFHVAPYFRVDRSDEPQFAEFAAKPETVTPEVRELMFPYEYPDSTGKFSFEPNRTYLGHTEEDMSLNPDESLYLWPYFLMESLDYMRIKLRTHFTAPTIHAGTNLGRPGPFTYEMINEYKLPLWVTVSDLVCPAVVSGDPNNPAEVEVPKGNYGTQERGKIALGSIRR